MFLVRDDLNKRKRKIKGIYSVNPVYGYLMAQANLIWVIKRAIMIMDRKSAGPIYKNGLDRYKSLAQYARIWEQQTKKTKSADSTAKFISLDKIIKKWDKLQKIGSQINPIARKATGEVMPDYSEERLEILLEAAGDVNKYAKSVGIDAFKRLPVYRSNSRRSRG